ncbi:HalOD1 output domain-containing protein [Natrinema caseinilyticum]|uniref:HalOD1 output domain-containing protein n=1 Tax=Natrinema caseinilyticum TaxID=2961570 RepID=UPI0020C28AF5|nr:HalOD1 output domain-containing protein [Natrinema caseinilyticum]
MTPRSPRHDQTAVEQVIRTIADDDDVDPVSISPPLADVIDPDALNELVDHGSRNPDGNLEVEFAYRGHDVVVTSDGTVELDRTELHRS